AGGQGDVVGGGQRRAWRGWGWQITEEGERRRPVRERGEFVRGEAVRFVDDDVAVGGVDGVGDDDVVGVQGRQDGGDPATQRGGRCDVGDAGRADLWVTVGEPRGAVESGLRLAGAGPAADDDRSGRVGDDGVVLLGGEGGGGGAHGVRAPLHLLSCRGAGAVVAVDDLVVQRGEAACALDELALERDGRRIGYVERRGVPAVPGDDEGRLVVDDVAPADVAALAALIDPAEDQRLTGRVRGARVGAGENRSEDRRV